MTYQGRDEGVIHGKGGFKNDLDQLLADNHHNNKGNSGPEQPGLRGIPKKIAKRYGSLPGSCRHPASDEQECGHGDYGYGNKGSAVRQRGTVQVDLTG